MLFKEKMEMIDELEKMIEDLHSSKNPDDIDKLIEKISEMKKYRESKKFLVHDKILYEIENEYSPKFHLTKQFEIELEVTPILNLESEIDEIKVSNDIKNKNYIELGEYLESNNIKYSDINEENKNLIIPLEKYNKIYPQELDLDKVMIREIKLNPFIIDLDKLYFYDVYRGFQNGEFFEDKALYLDIEKMQIISISTDHPLEEDFGTNEDKFMLGKELMRRDDTGFKIQIIELEDFLISEHLPQKIIEEVNDVVFKEKNFILAY